MLLKMRCIYDGDKLLYVSFRVKLTYSPAKSLQHKIVCNLNRFGTFELESLVEPQTLHAHCCVKFYCQSNLTMSLVPNRRL